jgi:leucyl aminopeptidase (aminopeptidase T)
MKTRMMFVVAGLSLVAVLAGIPIAGCSQRKSPPVDYEALAQKLVNQCANIHEGDYVLISGGVRDFELLENVAVHVRKAGAFPLVSLYSDRMRRRNFDDVPAKYDSQNAEFELKLAGLITAWIDVDSTEKKSLLAGLPPERVAASRKASSPVNELLLKRNVRYVNLGNELYPTSDRAREFGLSREELSKIFWDGVNVDYSRLQATGKAIKDVLASGKQVHITNRNGTDLTVQIEGRPVFVSDGVISADDVKTGGAACWTYLPAGEVFLAPVLGTAEGKFVVDAQFFQGAEVQGLTLTFKAGKLASMTAKSGLEPLKALYDAAGPGKEVFAFIDVGINPNVHVVPGSRMACWMPAGMVTVGIGDNTWAGGKNDVGYDLCSFLPGCTLQVDGKTLVDKGDLTVQP